MDPGRRIECNLQEQKAILQDVTDKLEIIRLCHDDLTPVKALKDAIQLPKNPSNFDHFLKYVSLVEDLIEIFISFGREATEQLIFSMTDEFIDVIVFENTPVLCKMELLRVFNLLLEGCSQKTSQELMKRENFKIMIESLFSQISYSGDFEMQVMLIESVLRLLPQKLCRKKYLCDTVTDSSMFSKFLNIRDSHFDVDCRKFLNQLNEKQTSSGNRVYSFPAEDVKLDGEQLYKPEDEDYGHFWIDFNTGSKRISIFCQSTLLPSQLSQNTDSRWETVSIRAKDVNRYKCDVKDNCWLITVELKTNAEILTNRESENIAHLFVCHVSKLYDIETALTATLKMVKQKKVSIPENSYRFEKESVAQDSSSVMKNQTKKVKSPSNRSSQKSSIPLEPITVITSSLSSVDDNQCVSWQSLHNHFYQKKLNNINPPDKKLVTNSLPKHSKHLFKNLTTDTQSEHSCKVSESSEPIKVISKNSKAQWTENKTGNRGKTFVAKESYSMKEKINVFNSKYCPSPVTASGDNICVNEKSEIKDSDTEKVAPRDHNETDSIIPETQILCEKRNHPGRHSHKDETFHKPNPKQDKSFVNKAKETKITTIAQQKNTEANDPPIKKTGLRSGQKISTPVVFCKSLIPKQRKTLQNEPKTNTLKKSLMDHTENVESKDESSPRKRSIQTTECISKNKINRSKKQPLCELNFGNTPVDSIELDNNKDASRSLEEFKAPKSFNKFKKCGKSKKCKHGKNKNAIIPEQGLKYQMLVYEKKSNDEVLAASNETLVMKSKDDIHHSQVKRQSELEEKSNTSTFVSNAADQVLINENNSKGKVLTPLSVSLPMRTNEDFHFSEIANQSQQDQNDNTSLIVSSPNVKVVSNDKSNNKCFIPPSEIFSTKSKQELRKHARQMQKNDTANVSELSLSNKKDDTKDSNLSDGKSIVSSQSSESGELYMEIENTSNAERVQGQDLEDCVNETHIEKPLQIEMGRMENLDSMEDGNIHGINSQDHLFSKQLTYSKEDTQNSNTFISSYVFKKNKSDDIKMVGLLSNNDRNDRKNSLVSKKRNDELSICKADKICSPSTHYTSDTMDVELSKSKAQCDRQSKMIPNSSPTISSSNDIMVKPHDNANDSISCHMQLSDYKNRLRSRNKDICYAECQSVLESTSDMTDKTMDVKMLAKSLNATRNDRDSSKNNYSYLSIRNHEVETVTPFLNSITPESINKSLVKQHKPVKIKEKQQKYRIWRSQEVKTTVTTIPMTVGSDCSPSDPYDFDSDCLTRLHGNFAPDMAHLFQHEVAPEPSQKDKHRKSKKFTESTSYFQHKYSQLSDIMKSAKVELNQKIQAPQKVMGRKGAYKAGMKKSAPRGEMTSRNLGYILDTSNGYYDSSPDREANKHNKKSAQDKSNSPKKVNSGLIFPHLADSIPCTPYNDNDKEEEGIRDFDIYSLNSRSRGTELSWIAKVNTSPRRRKQMRGKTYGQQNLDMSPYESKIYGKFRNDISDDSPEPLNSPENVPRYENFPRRPTKTKHKQKKIHSASDVSINSFPSSTSDSPRRGNEATGTVSIGQKKTKKLSSILTPRKESMFDGKEKTPKRRLSFKVEHFENEQLKSSPNTKGVATQKKRKSISSQYPKVKPLQSPRYSFSPSRYFWNKLSSMNQTSFEEINKEKKRPKSNQYSKRKSIQSPRFSFSLAEHSGDDFSSKNQDSAEELSEGSKFNKGVNRQFKGSESGYSSRNRPSKSALKRKHNSMSSDVIDELSCSDSDLQNISRVSKLRPKKLFNSEIHLSVESQDDSKTEEKSCIQNLAQTSSGNLSSDNESEMTSNINIYDFSHAILSNKEAINNSSHKSKHINQPQKKIKLMPSPMSVNSGRHFQSPDKPKVALNKNSMHTPSSHKSKRGNIKKTKNTTPNEKASNLNLTAPSLSPLPTFSFHSLFTLSSIRSLQNSPNIDNHKKKLVGHKLQKDIEDLDSIDGEMKEMENDEGDFNVSFKGLKDLIQMDKSNSVAQSQASSSMGDTTLEYLESTNGIMKTSWTEGHEKRSKALVEFDRCLLSVVRKSVKFSKELKEAELKSTLLWTQQMHKLKSHREFSEQSMDSLKYACVDLMNEAEEAFTNQNKVKKSVKSALKNDFDALAMKLKAKFHEHSLDTMKRCLQATFLM